MIDRMVRWSELKLKLGWIYSRAETWRRIKAGRFPTPHKGKDHNNPPFWYISELVDPLGMSAESMFAALTAVLPSKKA
jgi:hypothetical protein